MNISHLAGLMLAVAACGIPAHAQGPAQSQACNSGASNPLDYAGKYGLSNGSVLNIRESGGRFFARIDGTRPFQIFQTSPGRFEAKDRSFQVRFCGGRDAALDLVVEVLPAADVRTATFAQLVDASRARAQAVGASSAGTEAAGSAERNKRLP